MRSCTCIRTPYKYVTEPKKAADLDSEFSGSSKVAQSLVTDSDIFDREALLKQEGSTDYEDGGSDFINSSSSSSVGSDSADYNEELEQLKSSRRPSNDHSSKGAKEEENEADNVFVDDKLRNTVERWNALLTKYDEEPDIAEVQEVLNIVTRLTEGQDEETRQKIVDTIKRLTSSLIEASSVPEEVDTEVVLQECVGEDDETYFKCFVRKVREHTGTKVELEVNELVGENIRVLFNSLGLVRRNRSVDGVSMITRMASSIKGSTVFKNLYPEAKTSMDLTTYLHQLSEKVDNDDLASVSTLSELEVNTRLNPFSNCFINTSQCCDESVYRLIKTQNSKLTAFWVEQMRKQAMLRNKYEDLSDQPLFII